MVQQSVCNTLLHWSTRAQADYAEQGNDQWGNGKILLLPTIIVNKHQYRGRLDVPSVLRALCAGFSETTEPQVRAATVPRLIRLLIRTPFDHMSSIGLQPLNASAVKIPLLLVTRAPPDQPFKYPS